MNTDMKRISTIIAILFFYLHFAHSQNIVELNSNWVCKNIKEISIDGQTISNPKTQLDSWMTATVPGTVLTTLINNKKEPDPFWGMNNKKIPDIYYTGRDHYTYWFVNNFKLDNLKKGNEVWLNFRGINYSCDVYLNGTKLNQDRHYGMYLRQKYNITDIVNSKGDNRLAVIVYPPDPVGEPNGGQGGDGEIARNVSHQYTAGWDWIQPIRDRNTGIWDKVTIETTGAVDISNPHVITNVKGVRFPGEKQDPASITSTIELQNPSKKDVDGTVVFDVAGVKVTSTVTVKSNESKTISLPDLVVNNPKLWWPNGYGKANLYDAKFSFITAKNDTLDSESLKIGIRDIHTSWDEHTNSALVFVNGQKVFIKGGNWIISDALLRFTNERYDHEIRFHRDMNLNLIRIWGGALLERPEFYEACDKYGLLVMQDFWISGDCNGKWVDPLKKEDQWTRRKYPDDHGLFIQSAYDGVKLIRNHASLAFWCGGNEITPPKDILHAIQDSILPTLDGTRKFFPYSNSDEMSLNTIGNNGDGPYTIQDIKTFWSYKTWPFNSEVGSVCTGDVESLERFIPKKNLVVPDYINNKIDSVWQYHKDIGYGPWINRYGKAKDIHDFGIKAQLVNYNQYRALAEGFSNQIWNWYTGFIIWKTQNPWTALRGQMYDYYLDVNACLYGLRNGAEPIHVMLNPLDGMVSVVNNTFKTQRDLMLEIRAYNLKGDLISKSSLMTEVAASFNQRYLTLDKLIEKNAGKEGMFIDLRLVNEDKETVSNNFYWIPNTDDSYAPLQNMPKSKTEYTAKKGEDNTIEVTISTQEKSAVSFFNRISLIDNNTGKRILPVFYSDNYISVLPGESQTVILNYPSGIDLNNTSITIESVNNGLKKIGVQ